MPDSTPGWEPNETFWDDAWQDMDRRLRRRDRRRWWLLIPLLLFSTGVGVFLFIDGNDGAAAEGNPPESTTIIRETPLLNEFPPAPTGTTAGDQREPFAAGAMAFVPATEQTGPTIASDRGPILPPPQTPHPATAPLLLPTPAVKQLPLLPTLAFSAVHPATVELSLQPSVPPPPRFDKQTGATTEWIAGAAVQAYAGYWTPGPLVEAGIQLRNGKWRLPVLLRYDYGYRSVSMPQTDDAVYAERLVLDQSLLSFGQSNLQAANTFSGSMRAHTVSLNIGLGRRFGKRLLFTAGTGMGYLIGGTAPSLRSVPLAGTNSLAFQYDPRGMVSADLRADANPEAGTAISRWDATARARMDYRLGSRWSLGLELGRHLLPLYEGDLLREGRTRVAIGVRKRW